MFSTRKFWSLFMLLTLLLAACSSTASNSNSSAGPAATQGGQGAQAGTSIPNTGASSGKKLSGTLSVYLNAYYDPTGDKDTAAVAQQLAKQYESQHPGVTIKLVANLPASTDMETYLAARMAAGQSPDVMWQQFGTRNLRGSSWWVPLNKYFDMPNPYIAAGQPGHDKWSDLFQDYVLNQTRATDGNWYQVSLDWVETGLYYNKDLFSKAGVDPSKWMSWGQYISDMKKIKEQDKIAPLGMFVKQQGWSNWWWADDIFLTAAWGDKANDFYLPKYNNPAMKWRQLNPEEIAKAILDGKLKATDPRMDGYLKMSKDFVSLFPSDYASIGSLDDLDPLFFGQKVASVWTGTWKNKPYVKNIPFNYGITYLPAITKQDAPGAQGTAYRVGGPSSAGQYGIAQSAAKAGKTDLAVDFLMFLSAPENFSKLAKVQGGFIPVVKGAQAGDVMKDFSNIAKLPERLFNDPDNRLTLESADAWNQAMMAYFLGQTDIPTTKNKLQQIWMDGAKKLCSTQKYDWCPK